MSDKTDAPKPRFFATPAALRRWLLQHHETASELWVGMYKVSTGRKSVTWKEVVDEVLCVGWIDGIRKSIDADSYMNRITPRRRGSNWSTVNIRRVHELIAEGRMQPAGLRAFEERTAARSSVYSFEQERDKVTLPAAYAKRFKANKSAWAFFQAQPAGYQRTASWWVISAKQETTRERRLATLIADSAAGQRIAQLRPALRPAEKIPRR
jgi:uncharacterized protein YdeI (YjbR/CyaY-like superfamily)